jgi:hypothetical protein
MPLALDTWDEISEQVEKLYGSIKKVSSVAVNSTQIKQDAKRIVQNYFREARPAIGKLGISESDLALTDEIFQTLNSLAQSNNRKTTYQELLRRLREQLVQQGIRRHVLAGQKGSSQLTPQQTTIILTLKAMIPSAASSFEQAIVDLADTNRLSYRGTAAELREVIRETIDNLAPDDTVSTSAGFQFEKDQHGKPRATPTMKQKVRFLLKSRGKGTNAVANAQDTLQQLESGPDNLARSIYNRGSAATHTAQVRKEIMTLQRYTEVLLADLLEIE